MPMKGFVNCEQVYAYIFLWASAAQAAWWILVNDVSVNLALSRELHKNLESVKKFNMARSKRQITALKMGQNIVKNSQVDSYS